MLYSFKSCVELVQADFVEYKQRCGISSSLKAILLLGLFHRGFQLALSLRLQKWLPSIPLLGGVLRRVVAYLTSVITGSEVSFMASFGGGVFFPHPSGIVIGDNWIIGSRVTIMQNVTLGARRVRKDVQVTGVIENEVVISSGAVVLDGIVVGFCSVVGANAVVLSDVSPNCIAVGVPATVKLRTVKS